MPPNILLVHQCNKESKKKKFPIESEIICFPGKKCTICYKMCDNLCIECNKPICNECQQYHIPNENFISNEEDIEEIEIRRHIWPVVDVKLSCKEHSLQFQFFCPVCKKKLLWNM